MPESTLGKEDVWLAKEKTVSYPFVETCFICFMLLIFEKEGIEKRLDVTKKGRLMLIIVCTVVLLHEVAFWFFFTLNVFAPPYNIKISVYFPFTLKLDLIR